jgi:hypothetical protein
VLAFVSLKVANRAFSRLLCMLESEGGGHRLEYRILLDEIACSVLIDHPSAFKVSCRYILNASIFESCMRRGVCLFVMASGCSPPEFRRCCGSALPVVVGSAGVTVCQSSCNS